MEATPIELREVTAENHATVRALRVKPDQEGFVASVEKSLADAYVYRPDTEVRAAYLDGCPIGFVLLYRPPENPQTVNIVRLLIDARHQGQGLGRRLLETVEEWIDQSQPRPYRLKITVVPTNVVAARLYESAGYAGHEMEEGERVLWKHVHAG